MSKQIKIGMFGFGCVGQGLYNVLQQSRGIKAEIARIAVKDRSKQRSLPAELFTYEASDILNDASIDVVVELIDDAEAAYGIVTKALRSGKHVVTANKKMLANHLEELVALQQETGASLLYEASVCGGIPIIRTLEEYYDNELLHSVSGIFNGSSNYILTRLEQDGLSYEAALSLAQQKGFAESDPTLDVGGYDACNKLCILAAHAYGVYIDPKDVFCYGIDKLSAEDLAYARQLGTQVKLVATIQKLSDDRFTLLVMPQFIADTDKLNGVNDEYNAVRVEAAFSDVQYFIGKGAGGHPTGSAVLSDLSALTYQYKYSYKKAEQPNRPVYETDIELNVYLRYVQQVDIEGLSFGCGAVFTQGEGSNYVSASISLKNLIALKSELLKRNISIIRTNHQTTNSSYTRVASELVGA
jgi:homoserine dehydrogenase